MTLRGTINKFLKYYDKLGKWLDRFKYLGAFITIVLSISHGVMCKHLTDAQQQAKSCSDSLHPKK